MRKTGKAGKTRPMLAMDICTELPELICNGFFLLYFSEAWPCRRNGADDSKRQIVKYRSLCTLRLLSKEFRRCADVRILQAFEAAVRTIRRYSSLCRVHTGTTPPPRPDTPALETLDADAKRSALKFWSDVYEAGKMLCRDLRSSFGYELTRVILQFSWREARAVSESRWMDNTQVSVANFMAMSGYKCFWHCCAGISDCKHPDCVSLKFSSPTPLPEMDAVFQCVYVPASDGSKTKQTVFGSKSCREKLELRPSALRLGSNDESRLAVEMLRMTDNFGPYTKDTLPVCGHTQPGRSADNPVLIRHNEHLALPSLERLLGLTARDVRVCVARVEKQYENARRREAAIRKIDADMRLEELSDWISTRRFAGIDSFTALAERMPATAGYLRASIDQHRHCHVLDCGAVAQVATDLAFLMENEWVRATQKGGTPSYASIDFMMGKTAGLSGGGTLTTNADHWPISRHAACSEGSLDTDAVVDALTLFDKFPGLHILAVGGEGEWASGTRYGARLFKITNPANHKSYGISVPILPSKEYDYIKLSRPLLSGLVTIADISQMASMVKKSKYAAVDCTIVEAAKALLAQPQTRGLGIEFLGMGPKKLAAVAMALRDTRSG